MTVDPEAPLPPLPKVRTKTKQTNAPSFDVRAALYGLTGTDLTQAHGLGSSLALKLIGECGTDLRAWPSAKVLHIMALPRTRQQDLRRQSAVVTNSSLVQSSASIVAVGCDHDRAK